MGRARELSEWARITRRFNSNFFSSKSNKPANQIIGLFVRKFNRTGNINIDNPSFFIDKDLKLINDFRKEPCTFFLGNQPQKKKHFIPDMTFKNLFKDMNFFVSLDHRAAQYMNKIARIVENITDQLQLFNNLIKKITLFSG